MVPSLPFCVSPKLGFLTVTFTSVLLLLFETLLLPSVLDLLSRMIVAALPIFLNSASVPTVPQPLPAANSAVRCQGLQQSVPQPQVTFSCF